MIVRAASGSARDALSLLEQGISYAGKKVSGADIQAIIGGVDVELLGDFTDAIAGGKVDASFHLVARAVYEGRDLRQVATELVGYFRDLLLLRVWRQSRRALGQPGPSEPPRGRCPAATRASIAPATRAHCVVVAPRTLRLYVPFGIQSTTPSVIFGCDLGVLGWEADHSSPSLRERIKVRVVDAARTLTPDDSGPLPRRERRYARVPRTKEKRSHSSLHCLTGAKQEHGPGCRDIGHVAPDRGQKRG